MLLYRITLMKNGLPSFTTAFNAKSKPSRHSRMIWATSDVSIGNDKLQSITVTYFTLLQMTLQRFNLCSRMTVPGNLATHTRRTLFS